MSMIDNIRGRNSKTGDSNKMPRTANVPPAPTPAPAPAVARYYDEEVLRRYEKDVERERLLIQLEQERDDWRRQALAAQDECRRLEVRIAQDNKTHEQAITKLTEDRNQRLDDLTHQRDAYKLNVTRFETKLLMQGKSILNLADAVRQTIQEMMNELKNERDPRDALPPDIEAAAAKAIADAIESDNEPLPRVVTAGPAPQSD